MRILVMVLLAVALGGCGEPCGASCDVDDDCESGLVCFGGQCAPSECAQCPRSCAFTDHEDGRCVFNGCGLAAPEEQDAPVEAEVCEAIDDG